MEPVKAAEAPVPVTGAVADEFMSIAEIAGTVDVEYKSVVVPAWGPKPVRLASVTADDIIKWSESNESPTAKRNMGLRLIIKSVVDANGKRLMDESHLNMLANKSHKATEALVKAILDLNGMNVKDEARAKKD